MKAKSCNHGKSGECAACDDVLHRNVRAMIEHIGDDPDREGVLDTPARVVRSWKELFGGYGVDPAKHLARTFPSTSDEMVQINGIDFFSACEHHMLPFFGTVDIAYVPRKRVVGLSKFARLVDGYARRLQIQEQLTAQIADAICAHVDNEGVAVRIRATHLCMVARGAKNPGARMTTTVLRGVLREPAARSEWLAGLPT